MSRKRLAVRVALVPLGFLGLVALAASAFALWLLNADLKPILEREASDGLERRVTLGALKVGWGDPLAIEFTDLRIANASWGSEPDMVRIGHLSALIDVRSLLRGVLRYEHLRIDNAAIVLERNQTGTGNWKFGGGEFNVGGFVIVPKKRTQFPTLIDLALAQGLVTYRISSGKVLRIALDNVLVRAGGEETPVVLQAEGAYNDVAIKLDAMIRRQAHAFWR
jgi:uncharacterized protein involved in outer membrane biogenesis